jgi:hypothetical protein
MTGSISYMLVDLVWINRMQNKWNEMTHSNVHPILAPRKHARPPLWLKHKIVIGVAHLQYLIFYWSKKSCYSHFMAVPRLYNKIVLHSGIIHLETNHNRMNKKKIPISLLKRRATLPRFLNMLMFILQYVSKINTKSMLIGVHKGYVISRL